MEYYSTIKNNEIMPFVATQMEIIIRLSKLLKKKKKYHMLSLPCAI